MSNRYDLAAIAAILTERARQDAKWGEQNHPDVDAVLMNRPGGCTPRRMAQHYEIPTATRAKYLTDTRARRGQCTFADILSEEFAEAVESATLDDGNVQTEVTQTAAVAVGWLGAIARRQGTSERVYIAGPIAGHDDNNRGAFATAAEELRAAGYEPVNPHDVNPHTHDGPCPTAGYFPGENDRAHTSSCCFMRTDLIALLTCDFIYMLDGWEKSRGASFEREVARVCGIPELNSSDKRQGAAA